MLKKLIALWVFAVALQFAPQAADAWPHRGTAGASTIPTFTPGTNVAFIPRSQTPTDPSVSQDGPRCLDSTWGACDVSQHCIAPTIGTPLESCQAPLQIITSSGTGTGTVATIHYTSASSFTYAVAQPLVISGATQANWNTPDVHLSNHWAVSNSDALCPSSGPSVEVGWAGAPLSVKPFTTGDNVYFSGLTGPAGGQQGFGWGSGAINATQPNGRHALVFSDTSTGKFCMTLEPLGATTITTRGSSTTIPAVTTFTGIPITTSTGSGSGMIATVTAGCPGCGFGGGVLAFVVTDWGNKQFKIGDTVTVGVGAGVGDLTGFVGTIASATSLTNNADGVGGHSFLPFAVSTSACTGTACTVTFANRFSCASSCVSGTTQIVAGQFDDDIVAWHYGENAPMKTFISGQNVVSCIAASHISPQQFVAFEGDGGLFTKVMTPIDDPWGPGGPWTVSGVGTVSQPFAAAKRVYCAQAAASSFVGDGEHEIKVIGCATAGYCTQLGSVAAIDGNTGSTFFTSHSHGKKDWSYQAITNSFDANFPNYNWAYTTSTFGFPDGQAVTLGTSTANGSGVAIPWTVPGAPILPPVANQTVGVTGITSTNSCTVSGGSQDATFLTLSLAGSCNFPTGSRVDIAGITTLGSCTITSGSISGGTATLNYSGACVYPPGESFTVSMGTGGTPTALNGVRTILTNPAGTITFSTVATGTVTPGTGPTITTANGSNTTWNGTTAIVTTGTGGACGGSCTMAVAGLATNTYVSGGTVKANLNGECQISSATTSSITCPNLAASGTTGTGGTFVNLGNTFCVVGGYGDNPTPYTKWDYSTLPFNTQMTTDSFQLIARDQNGGVANAETCSTIGGRTGCQFDQVTHTTPCGILPTQAETLWSWDKDSGKQQGDGGVAKLMMGSYFFYTNVGGGIQSSRAYVDSWDPASSTSGPCRNASTFNAGISIATPAYAGTVCNNMTLAVNSLIAPIGGSSAVVQSLQQITVGSTQCLVFKNAANVGTPSLYKGQPIDYQNGYDTNSGTDANTGVAKPELGFYAQYWVVGVGLTDTGDANGVTLGLRPGGPCINETASLIANTAASPSTAMLMADIGFDEVLFRCNTTLSVPCSASHPETYTMSTSSVGYAASAANSGYLNLDPDLSFAGTESRTISLILSGSIFPGPPEMMGRIRQAISTNDDPINITPAVTIGPTPPQETVTGGSLATCPAPNAAHQCETLNHAAVVDDLSQPNGGQFQQPTGTGGKGQPIVVAGFTSTSWNCGSSISVPCLGAAGGVAGIISSTTTSVTFINDVATGSATGTGLVTPVGLVVEAASGTFAQACAGSNAAPINTATSTYCFVRDTATGNVLGTNQYSQGILFTPFGTNGVLANTPSMTNTANCMSTQSGPNTVSVLMKTVVPAATSGTTNDIMILAQPVVGQNPSPGTTRALNQCTAIQMGNNPFGWSGNFSDLWQDSIQYNGNNFYLTHAAIAGPNGMQLITNSYTSNSWTAFSGSSYVWGDRIDYTEDCINSNETNISIYCVSGQPRIPTSLGGTLNNDGSITTWVTNGWDASGTPTTCGGQKCLGDASSTDQGTATVSIGVVPGSLSPSLSVNWEVFVSCGVVSDALVGNSDALTGSSGLFIHGFNNAATTHAPSDGSVLMNGGISGECLIPTGSPTSGFPAAYWNDGNHSDYNFLHYNGDVVLPNQTVSGASNWMHFKDFVTKNVTCLCATNEEMLTQGGNYWNIAHEEETVFVYNNAYPGGSIATTHGLALNGGSELHNYVFKNDNYTTIGRVSPTENQTINGLYYININGGNNALFPAQGADPQQQAYHWATSATLGSWAGASLFGSYDEDLALVPSASRFVDPVTGLPTTPAAEPMYNSFLAEPWYGVGSSTGDSGLGSF